MIIVNTSTYPPQVQSAPENHPTPEGWYSEPGYDRKGALRRALGREPETLTGQSIHLAHGEWGNEKMQQVAREALASNPELFLVTVNEHAGWFLEFARHPDNPEDLITVGTANDYARFDGIALDLQTRARCADWVFLPAIRREDTPSAPFA